MSKELSEQENVIVGVVAAFIESIILQPTLYWKNAKAVGMPFSLNPRIIYRGTAASIFNECQMMGVQFGITSFFQHHFPIQSNGKLSRRDDLLSAALGGMFSAAFTSPLELIMIQQQRFGGSIARVPLEIGSKYGLAHRGLMRGLAPTMMRDSLYVVGMLGVTPLIQEHLMVNYNYSAFQAGLYASLSGGIIAALPSHPFDLIKTCMQGDLNQSLYKSLPQTVNTLYTEGGIRRLYSGCLWRTVNITGTIYIANECRQILPRLLFE